jgi:hypothetical protein
MTNLKAWVGTENGMRLLEARKVRGEKGQRSCSDLWETKNHWYCLDLFIQRLGMTIPRLEEYEF